MTSEFGAPTQLEKIDMIDFADLIVINKFERKGSEDALRQVQKQYQRSLFCGIKIWMTCRYMAQLPVNLMIKERIHYLRHSLTVLMKNADWIGKHLMNNSSKHKSKMSLFQMTVVIIYVKLPIQFVAIIKNPNNKWILHGSLFQLEGAIEAVKEKAPNDALIAFTCNH